VKVFTANGYMRCCLEESNYFTRELPGIVSWTVKIVSLHGMRDDVTIA
jgi:hypothetical protein